MDDNLSVQWRPIKGYPKYYVSNTGQVASVMRGKFHVLSSWPNQYGHQYVQIQNEYERVKIGIHRLVAETFLSNPEGYPIVMHKDDNPSNNHVDNLKWGTFSDNTRDCIEKERNYTRPIYCFETGKLYRSCAEAAEDFQVCRPMITACCEGKAATLKDLYHLCYVDDLDEKRKDKKWLLKQGNYKPVKAINITDGKVLYFKSRQLASRVLGVSDSGISSTIVGRLKQSGGWIFEEFDLDKEGDVEWISQ